MLLETGESPGDFLDGRLLIHVIESAPVGFGLQDADGTVTYANPCLVEMLGYPDSAQLVGRQVESLVVAEELESYRGLREQRRSGQMDLYALTLQRKDGGKVATLVSPVPILGPDGELIASAGFIMDVAQFGIAGATAGGLGADKALFEELTAREREVFDSLVAGQSVRKIAEARSISEHTVRNQIKSIYRKLGLHSRLDLLRTALGR